MEKWISIEAQMPPIERQILLGHDGDKWVVTGYRTKADRGKYGRLAVSYWNWFESRENEDCEIYPTHWMKLPKAPVKYKK